MSSIRARGVVITFAALALAAPLASGQTFQASYSSNTSAGNDIINSRDCGFVATGNTGGFRAFVMRLDPEGQVVWSKAYQNPGFLSRGYSVVESSANDDLIVSGTTGVQAVTDQLRFVMRTDSSGTPVWAVALSGGTNTLPPGQTGVGGFLPVGATEMHKGQIASIGRLLNSNGAARIGLLSMLDADGSLLFSSRYVPPGGTGIFLDFIQAREARDPDPNNEVLVLGSLTISTNFLGLFAMRTDIDGNIIWSKVYRLGDGITSMLGSGFDLAANGDILFSASRAVLPAPFGTSPGTIIGRIDSLTGDPIWSVSVDDFGPGYQAVTCSPDDVMVVAGLVGNGHDTASAALRVDASGHNAQIWQYGNIAPVSQGLAEAVVPVRPWGGYALFGRNDEFSILDGVFMIRTNNDMLSRCTEDERHAVASDIEIRGNNVSLQIVADTTYIPLIMTATDLGLKRQEQCLFSRCLGDLNADGLVDDSDFVIFAGAYDILLCPTDPSITCCPADLNGDGFVDDSDFVLFANAYDQLICP
ncbi:MAG: hypothetical protein U0573_02250 [Phycisphaerales bacterium]|nr:hypothetical protein [Planctomycetota bacterium]